MNRLCILGVIGFAMPVWGAESIDESMAEIAATVVSAVPENVETAIGISTFTHTDGTCSDLSNFISETLLYSLFDAGNGQLRLIERSQLSAIFREMELVFDGTVAPSAARRIGEIEGVDAIATGNITLRADRMQVSVRLIGTKDGAVIAAARSDFPVTATDEGMMTERAHDACGFGEYAETQNAEDNPGVTENVQEVVNADDPAKVFRSDVFTAEIFGLFYNSQSGNTSYAIRYQNTYENPIGLSFYPGSLVVSDGRGGIMGHEGDIMGVRTCYGAGYEFKCNTSYPEHATSVPAGKTAQMNFFTTGSADLSDPRLTINFEMVVTPDLLGTSIYDVRSVGFYDVKPTAP